MLAEKALILCQFFDSAEDVRKRGASNDIDVYPSNYKYSKVRAFLNGLPYDIMESGSQKDSTEFEMKGFLQTAFTFEERKKILRTLVDNSPESTNPDGNPNHWNSGKNEYACDDTKDHIFLLSVKEATTASYGFADNPHTNDGARLQIATDFALANGAKYSTDGSRCLLRSPNATSSSTVCAIVDTGRVDNYGASVDSTTICVVPALCIGPESVQ
ncbi:MAG: hypothetical protein IJR50_08780 [Treponema sp.]|nr:hypothetical protein [Treponema sp.]